MAVQRVLEGCDGMAEVDRHRGEARSNSKRVRNIVIFRFGREAHKTMDLLMKLPATSPRALMLNSRRLCGGGNIDDRDVSAPGTHKAAGNGNCREGNISRNFSQAVDRGSNCPNAAGSTSELSYFYRERCRFFRELEGGLCEITLAANALCSAVPLPISITGLATTRPFVH